MLAELQFPLLTHFGRSHRLGNAIQKMTQATDVSIIARLISGVAAIARLFILLLGPMYLYRTVAGIPLEARGPSWEVWLLVIGCAVGAGAARFVHNYLITRVFGATDAAEQRAWGRRP